MKGKAYRNRLGCSYDARGNRKRALVASGSDTPDVTTYAANRFNQYSAVTHSALSASPREIRPSYDLNGNQKSAKPKAQPTGDRDFKAVAK